MKQPCELKHLMPIDESQHSRKFLETNLAMDISQYHDHGRPRYLGGMGFLFVRFREQSDSEDSSAFDCDDPLPVLEEHCVAESNGGDIWECPCQECKPWLKIWRHLFAALWGVSRVSELVDNHYQPPSNEECIALQLEAYMANVGKDWECIQWEDGMDEKST